MLFGPPLANCVSATSSGLLASSDSPEANGAKRLLIFDMMMMERQRVKILATRSAADVFNHA
jgi:hypothetical protein